MMKRRHTLIFSMFVTFIAALAPAFQASAGSLSLNGELLDEGPFWHRPLTLGDTDGTYSAQGTCSALDVYATPVTYNLWYFHVTQSGQYQISLNPDDAGLDGQLVLYGEGAPFPGEYGDTPCLANVDDDISGASCCPDLYVDLMPGVTYTLVVTTYDDDEFGTYALDISGPGEISTQPLVSKEIPTLSVWGVVLLSGLLGLWVLVTLRKRPG